MNKKLNFISNLFFYLILVSGVLYTVFLIIAIKKMVPGFTMNLIFLLDTLKYNNFNNNLFNLIRSSAFLINIVSGPIILFLAAKYINALKEVFIGINKTNKFISQLKTSNVNQRYVTFNSAKEFIFTAGFFKPKIFISSAIFKSHNSVEIEAMLLHEENHQNNHHPLKVFIANFIGSFSPAFPGKKWILGNYLTLTEVTSDNFAENKINNKLPLVSALLKLQQSSLEPIMDININGFNSQSERIKILIGQKILPIKQTLTIYSLVLVVVLSSTIFLKHTNIYFNCQHLIKCFEVLVNPSFNSVNNSLEISNHCQKFTPLTHP